uniref:MD-2-related lipid-recognition domain-containing protein n=1 Tax=Anopheles culicifacies TaxID=139723 RepID=A0A182MU18_9DIPT
MQYGLPTVQLCMVALFCSEHQTFGTKLTYERTEQTLGQDMSWFDLRCNLDVFYSRLGNQQFNYMPIKLPTAGICQFMNNLHENYESYWDVLENAPEPGECPITKRVIRVAESEFPTDAVPQVVIRNGLYKATFHCYLHGKEVLTYSVYLKATDH